MACRVQAVSNAMVRYTLPTWWSNQEVHDLADLHTIATWTCNSGYSLYGAQSMTCLQSGNWNHTAPTCGGTEYQNQYNIYFKNYSVLVSLLWDSLLKYYIVICNCNVNL